MRELTVPCPADNAAGACAFDWCTTDHVQEPGHRLGTVGTFTDMYGKPETVALYHCPDTGRTCLFLGEHEVTLPAGLEIVSLIHKAVELGVGLPGAISAAVAR
jgi:hypothetical protein